MSACVLMSCSPCRSWEDWTERQPQLHCLFCSSSSSTLPSLTEHMRVRGERTYLVITWQSHDCHMTESLECHMAIT